MTLSPMDHVASQVADDIRACHEFYCKYNCGTLNPPGSHTSRCGRLTHEYGLPTYPSGLPGKEKKKWPPLDPGTRVRTTESKTKDTEWMPEARAARKWGVEGVIIMHHDSHGLCYDVLHDDGTNGSYEPTEFEVLKPKSAKR